MTDDEKRQQRAMLLLQHEETRQELELLRSKAWNISQEVGEISHWLEDARERNPLGASQRERNEKIIKNVLQYRALFDFDAIVALREELERVSGKLSELTEQKKTLGLGT